MKHIFILLFTVFSLNCFAQAFSFSADFTDINNIEADTIGEQVAGKTTDPTYFGGEIDYIVTSNTASSRISIFNTSFFLGYETDGSIEYIWDGVDADSFGISFANNLADLGNCGDISIDFSESSFGTSVLNFDLTIELYNSASNYISWTGPVALADMPLTVTANTSLFQTFGPAPFDFSDLRAMRFIINTDFGDNFEANILSVSWVPDLSPGAACDPIPSMAVPTLGQWAVLSLFLCLIIVGVIASTSRINNIAFTD